MSKLHKNYIDNLKLDKFARVIIDDNSTLSEISGALQFLKDDPHHNWICNTGCHKNPGCNTDSSCQDTSCDSSCF